MVYSVPSGSSDMIVASPDLSEGAEGPIAALSFDSSGSGSSSWSAISHPIHEKVRSSFAGSGGGAGGSSLQNLGHHLLGRRGANKNPAHATICIAGPP